MAPGRRSSGASSPPHSRLYEFTNWFVTAVISGACLSRPATNCRPIVESWYWPAASKNAFASPSNSDRWVCMPDPGWPDSGFGMNVA